MTYPKTCIVIGFRILLVCTARLGGMVGFLRRSNNQKRMSSIAFFVVGDGFSLHFPLSHRLVSFSFLPLSVNLPLPSFKDVFQCGSSQSFQYFVAYTIHTMHEGKAKKMQRSMEPRSFSCLCFPFSQCDVIKALEIVLIYKLF